MNELSYLCGLKNHAMNSEKFAEITARCQPHEVFSNEWTTYYPDDFADTLLPDAGIIKGKSLRFYDGAGIVPTTDSFPQHYMKLSTNDQIVSLIFFSYPKGVTAGEKVEGIRLGHDELWIHCSTYLSAITSTGQKASDAHVTALQNELKEMKSGTLPAKEEILPPDDYYLYWDCTDFISQQAEIGELLITIKVVTAEGNSETLNYPKANVKKLFQNAKENNYIIILDANDEEVQVFGASIIDRQTRFIKRIAEIYNTLSDEHKLILHLPEIMVKLGWLHGALCQIHWLEGSKATLKFPYEFFMSEERVENVDTLKLKEYFKKKMFLTKNDRIDFLYHNPDLSQLTMGEETGALSELLLQCGVLYNEDHSKVRESLNLFRKNLALRETDGPVGDFLKLYKEIREYEEVQKNPDRKKEYINETFFQSFELGSEIDLDNVGSALGKYSLRCYYTGYLHKNTPSSEWILDIEKVQCRFFDSFNFIDDKTKLNPKTWISQPLGCWKFDTEDVKEPLLPMILLPNWYSLSNKDFRELQNILHSKVSNSCNDFYIRSNLKTFSDEYIKKSIQIR